MSLTLRTELTRALTHDELDANFKYLNLKQWGYNDYQLNQLVFNKDENGITVIYRCKTAHIRYAYDPTSKFTTVVTIQGTTSILWEAVSSNYLLSLIQLNETNFVDSTRNLGSAPEVIAYKKLKFTDLVVNELVLVININSIASKHFVLELPTNNEPDSILSLGKKLKIVMKSNKILDKRKNFMISTPWINDGSTNKLLSTFVNSEVENVGYFIPMETLETIDLIFDGIDWIAVSTSKQQYVMQDAQNFTNDVSAYINRQ